MKILEDVKGSENSEQSGTEGAPSVLSPKVLDKRALSKKKDEFALHVALIMHQDMVAKSKAVFTAWLEGQQGLATRLKPQAPAS